LKEAFVDSEDIQQVLAACLLMRLLDGHQSIHILCSKGLTVCSKVILRSNVEALVLLKYVAASKDNLQHYVASDQLQRKKWLNIVLNDKSKAFSDELRKGISEQMLMDIDNSINELGASDLKIEQLASRVGLNELYQTAYRMLSYDVHVLPRSLEKYWVLNEAEEVVAMNFTPKNEDILEVIVPSMATIINALDCYATLLGIHAKYELRLSEAQAAISQIGTEPTAGKHE
jgi:hypothetical protein